MKTLTKSQLLNRYNRALKTIHCLGDDREQLRKQLRAIQLIIEEADNCAMAVDGPVDKAINHMTDLDIRNIWILASGYKNPTLPPLKQPKKKHENHRT